MKDKELVQKIIQLLAEEHPDAKIALHYSNPLELLVATILSAQSTDKIVNEVTKTLFKKYRKADDYANADLKELEKDIKSTGFYRNKAKYLKKMGHMLVEKFWSKVPKTMDELTTLPGVARKTANIVLSNAFQVVEGIAVDTHVRRLSQRLGLSENKDPNKIERDLMKLVPKEQWAKLNDLLIFHGRRVCTAKKPNCGECTVDKLCPSAFTFELSS
ncbi:MAG: endonuclease III [Candidatus Bathyarchaeota archaeon]|nr:endonuclease III [Candidatus Bathyarchaeota archaeon]